MRSQENISYTDFVASLKWLEAEGYIERFYDEQGTECVRICEGSEGAVL
jgi:hypothetical protein